jgi:uncharacterized protein
MMADDYLKSGKVHVWKETFAVAKSRESFPGAFANIVDNNEITVIIDQSRLNEIDEIEAETGWKIFTFDMKLPFGLVGFLAKISGSLADEGIPIFAISAFSTDHILVKEKDLDRAVKKLEGLGCKVEI